MALVYYHNVKCDCGHEGRIKQRENDTPLSGDFWNRYSLENLEGNACGDRSPIGEEELFSKMNISCPNCKKKLSIDNLIG